MHRKDYVVINVQQSTKQIQQDLTEWWFVHLFGFWDDTAADETAAYFLPS